MLLPCSDRASGVSEPPGDFKANYRSLKKIINQALKAGTPIEELGLIPKDCGPTPEKKLSRDDLVRLLHLVRSIKNRYKALLKCPVPKELERDILKKAPHERLPWEVEALEKIARWRKDLKTARAAVQTELNEHLKRELFRGI
jgi:hypothetical protein